MEVIKVDDIHVAVSKIADCKNASVHILKDTLRSQLDILDIYEDRAVSEDEKKAIGKLKKRIHNDIGSAINKLNSVFMALVGESEIPRFGEER